MPSCASVGSTCHRHNSCTMHTTARHRLRRMPAARNVSCFVAYSEDPPLPRSPTPSNPSQTPMVGTPSTGSRAFLQQWERVLRPRIDALWRVVRQTSNSERFLVCFDELLMHLRSSRSTSVHLGQHHTRPDWVAAAQQVAAACSNYEQHISRSRAVSRRLQALEASLSVQLHQQQQDSNMDRKEKQPKQSQGSSTLSLTQQLQVCSALLRSLQSGTVEDSLQWLAVLELPDVNMERLQQLQQQEASLVAAIDDVLSQTELMRLPVDVPDQMLQELGISPRNPSSSLQSTPCAPAHLNSWEEQAASRHDATGTTDDEGHQEAACFDTHCQGNQQNDADGTCSTSMPQPQPQPQQHLWGSEQQQQQQQQQDASVQVHGAQQLMVNVTRSGLARLLRQNPVAVVRQQVHVAVLQPKLQQAVRLLARLARCRQLQAQLMKQSCYNDLMQERCWGAQHLSPANVRQSSSAKHTIEFLLILQQSLTQPCQQQVDWVLRTASQQQGEPPGGQQAEAHTPGNQPETCHDHPQEEAVPSRADGCSSLTSPDVVPPWDWDHLQHVACLQYTRPLQQHAPVLQQHLQLSGVLEGFSTLLQHLTGIQLAVRAPAEGEVWAPHVVVLEVWKQHQKDSSTLPKQQGGSEQAASAEPLGIVYVDVGGGYGARMLRYARSTLDAADISGFGDLPAVAVGISGALRHDAQSTPAQGGTCGVVDQHSATVPRGCCVLSVSQLWELGHELGHALHLVASSRQPACCLSGRFLPLHMLELPAHLMERLLLDPDAVTLICQHHKDRQPLPAHLAAALSAYYGCRYNSALAVSARVATGLAELMYGQYGGDMEDYWRGAWEVASGLPAAVAVAGSLQEAAFLPVMAAQQGTYHCYLFAWSQAAELYDSIFKPLLELQCTAGTSRDALWMQQQKSLQAAAWAVFSAHVGSPKSIAALPGDMSPEKLQSWLWRG